MTRAGGAHSGGRREPRVSHNIFLTVKNVVRENAVCTVHTGSPIV